MPGGSSPRVRLLPALNSVVCFHPQNPKHMQVVGCRKLQLRSDWTTQSVPVFSTENSPCPKAQAPGYIPPAAAVWRNSDSPSLGT